MRSLFIRCSKPVEDVLKWHPWCSSAASRLLSGLALCWPGKRTRALGFLVRAARSCSDPARRERLEARIRRQAEQLDADSLGGPADRADMPKALILKPPVSPVEKGLLYVTFEEQWLRLLRSGQAGAVAERYDLLLGPTWSPPHDVSLLLAARHWPGPVYTLLSNLDDAATMPRLSPNLVPVPLLASSWVNPAVYEPYLGTGKEFDLVMVANFAPYKRHWLFFQMLRDLPRRFRVLLLGVPLRDRTEKVLMDEARAYGVQGRFELRTRLSNEAVAEALCRSRASAIFSKQEGSCIAIVESLLADTPVAVFRDARIGSKAYVNGRTGTLLDRRRMAYQLERMIDNAHTYSPRPWAVEHVSCHRSYEVLNGWFRAEAEHSGRAWTRDLEPFTQNALPRYLTPESEAQLRPWYVDLAQSYGLTVAEPAWAEEQAASETPKALMRTGA